MSESEKKSDPISITVEFTYYHSCHENLQILIAFYSGGLEILFSNERRHNIQLPGLLNDGSRPNIAYLLPYLVDNVMKDQRKELFIMEDNVYVFLKKSCSKRN